MAQMMMAPSPSDGLAGPSYWTRRWHSTMGPACTLHTPTKKAKAGHDLHVSWDVSQELNVSYNPLPGGKVDFIAGAVVPMVVNTSGIDMTGLACAFHTPTKKAKEGHDLHFSPELTGMEIVPYYKERLPSRRSLETDLLYRCRNLHREKQEFKVTKASARGVLTQLRKTETLLKAAFQPMESQYLSYKDQLQTINAKMGLKRDLAEHCEKEIDIRNREIDHVNKRLRGFPLFQ